MRQKNARSLTAGTAKDETSSTSRTRQLAFLIASGLAIGCLTLTFAVKAFNWRAAPTTNFAPSSFAPMAGQGSPTELGRLQTRLALQPQADRFRRRLGKRFRAAGLELSVMTGTLTVGGQSYLARISRSQDDGGESIAISLGGGPASLTWNGKDGAKFAGGLTNSTQRAIIERLALDSPDQFVLAQLRGASYYTVAQNVVPEEAGDSYTGSAWDVVRIGEPPNPPSAQPQSPWRLYYLNTETGLIEKIISQEDGQTVLAEISGWVTQGSEQVPTRFTWSRSGQVLMELTLDGFSHGPKQ